MAKRQAPPIRTGNPMDAYNAAPNKAIFLANHPDFAKANPQLVSIAGVTGSKAQQAVGSDISAGQAANAATTVSQNPNVQTPFVSSNYDPTTNTYTEEMDPAQKAMLDAQQNLAKAGVGQATGMVNNFQPFQDPTAPQPYTPPTAVGPKVASSGQPPRSGGFGGAGGESYLPQVMPPRAIGQAGAGMPGGQLDPFRYQFQSDDAARQRIEQGIYDRLTRDLDQNYKVNREAKEQELYNKGIPYSDDPNSRYQRELGDIDKRYDRAREEAMQSAIESGGAEMSRNFGISSGTFNTNLGGMGQQFGQGLQTHQQQVSDIGALSNVGTGAIVQQGPGFQAPPPISYTPPSEFKLRKQELGLTNKQIETAYQIAALQQKKKGGEEEKETDTGSMT